MDNLIPILIHKTLGFIELFKKVAHISGLCGEFELQEFYCISKVYKWNVTY